MRNKHNKEETLIFFVLLCTILFISVIYIMYSTTLYIAGTAKTAGAIWKIKFENISTPIITGRPIIINNPILSDTVINGFRISINNPGDSVAYEFDIKNAGGFDAVLSTFYKNTPVCTGAGIEKQQDEETICNNFTYTLKYKNNSQNVKSFDTLNKGETKRLIITFTYNGINMPKEKVEITGLNISLVYEEKE